MSQFKFEMGEVDLQVLVAKHISEKLGLSLQPKDIKIEVKSKQNYKSEWEVAAYRASYSGEV